MTNETEVVLEPEIVDDLPEEGKPFIPRHWHYTAIQLAMTGAYPEEIGQVVNRSKVVVKAFLSTPWAREHVASLHARVMEQAATKILDPLSRFASTLDEKIKLLDQLTKSGDEKIALAAVKEWIAHTIGTPVRRTEVQHRGDLVSKSDAELRFIAEHRRYPTPDELRVLTATPTLPLLVEDHAKIA